MTSVYAEVRVRGLEVLSAYAKHEGLAVRGVSCTVQLPVRQVVYGVAGQRTPRQVRFLPWHPPPLYSNE